MKYFGSRLYSIVSFMVKTLYLGIDPPEDPTYVHYPVISTRRMETKGLGRAIAHLERFSHLIFTSKNGVRHWAEVGSFAGKQLIAIGPGTAEVIENLGFECLVAPEATQEGVIALLETIEDPESCFLYLRSKIARDLLKTYLRRRRGLTVDLYDTIFQKPLPVPSLEEFGAIVFTSPSTVDAYLQIYGKVPKHVQVIPIGPVTKRRLEAIDS
jgi:uroporphyrinogen-III synthase